MPLAHQWHTPAKKMSDAHAHMHLTETHFNAVAGHLVITLQELEVPQDLIDEVVDVAVSTKGDIVTAQQEVANV